MVPLSSSASQTEKALISTLPIPDGRDACVRTKGCARGTRPRRPPSGTTCPLSSSPPRIHRPQAHKIILLTLGGLTVTCGAYERSGSGYWRGGSRGADPVALAHCRGHLRGRAHRGLGHYSGGTRCVAGPGTRGGRSTTSSRWGTQVPGARRAGQLILRHQGGGTIMCDAGVTSCD